MIVNFHIDIQHVEQHEEQTLYNIVIIVSKKACNSDLCLDI